MNSVGQREIKTQQRVIAFLGEAGTPQPRIEFDGRDVGVELPFSEAYLQSIGPGQTENRTRPTTQETTQETAEERIWLDQLGERLGERLGESLGETEGRVLLLIRADFRISTRTLAEKIGVSTTAMDKTLARLKNRGILRRIGPARGGR